MTAALQFMVSVIKIAYKNVLPESVNKSVMDGFSSLLQRLIKNNKSCTMSCQIAPDHAGAQLIPPTNPLVSSLHQFVRDLRTHKLTA